jgi:hypothetical protein
MTEMLFIYDRKDIFDIGIFHGRNRTDKWWSYPEIYIRIKSRQQKLTDRNAGRVLAGKVGYSQTSKTAKPKPPFGLAIGC